MLRHPDFLQIAHQSDAEQMSQRFVSKQRLIVFYERKTQQILERYGPGPRVHYHTGLADEPPCPRASREELRAELIAAQERTLQHAAAIWNAHAWLSGDVLDVGCGLGGGAIFWAQGFGACVTALTIAPSHIELVDRFAALAGVRSRVKTLLCDALEVPGKNRFDAAVAIDSSNSFPREPWFRRLERLLRVRGHIFIADTFLGCDSYREVFERHWCAQIGTIAEYVAAAHEAGFAVERIEDVSLPAIHFWSRTLAFMRLEAQENGLNASERAKLDDSLRVHALVQRGLVDGGLRHMLMSFARQ
jgi:tocopherol O-methyltransferase